MLACHDVLDVKTKERVVVLVDSAILAPFCGAGVDEISQFLRHRHAVSAHLGARMSRKHGAGFGLQDAENRRGGNQCLVFASLLAGQGAVVCASGQLVHPALRLGIGAQPEQAASGLRSQGVADRIEQPVE